MNVTLSGEYPLNWNRTAFTSPWQLATYCWWRTVLAALYFYACHWLKGKVRQKQSA